MHFSRKLVLNILIFIPVLYFIFLIPVFYAKRTKIPSSKGEAEMAVNRDKIVEKDRWNIDKMYPSIEDWRKQLKLVNESEDWNLLVEYKNKLHESPLL